LSAVVVGEIVDIVVTVCIGIDVVVVGVVVVVVVVVVIGVVKVVSKAASFFCCRQHVV